MVSSRCSRSRRRSAASRSMLSRPRWGPFTVLGGQPFGTGQNGLFELLVPGSRLILSNDVGAAERRPQSVSHVARESGRLLQRRDRGDDDAPAFAPDLAQTGDLGLHDAVVHHDEGVLSAPLELPEDSVHLLGLGSGKVSKPISRKPSARLSSPRNSIRVGLPCSASAVTECLRDCQILLSSRMLMTSP